MIEIKNDKLAVPVVLFAGILWSFGPLVVRYMDQPELVPWQYIFGRGLTIFIILNLYLFFEEGIAFYKNYLKIGVSGILGVLVVGIFASGYPASGDIPPTSFVGQLVGAITMIATGFIPGYVISLVIKSMGWLRVPDEVQIAGIDKAELGLEAYQKQ